MVRIGTLGAARITPNALIHPAQRLPGVQVAAVAARDPERARAFAQKHAIPRIYASYEELIQAPEIDAIYNPLPNSLHCEWTVRALEAGKHVLCEKPFAANAVEAQRMADAARARDLVLMEAFHNLYHPLAARMRAIVENGALGTIRMVEAQFCSLLLRSSDIRLQSGLAGGATMDLGCYCTRLLCYLLGAEPRVVNASAQLAATQVDRTMRADLVFPNGVAGRFVCSLRSRRLLRASVTVRGDAGTMHVLNPFLPHLFHGIYLRTGTGVRWEQVRGGATYDYQLRAFVEAVRKRAPMRHDVAAAVANMRVIDAAYARAGVPRPGTG
jgi:predicted dehydrogenase